MPRTISINLRTASDCIIYVSETLREDITILDDICLAIWRKPFFENYIGRGCSKEDALNSKVIPYSSSQYTKIFALLSVFYQFKYFLTQCSQEYAKDDIDF